MTWAPSQMLLLVLLASTSSLFLKQVSATCYLYGGKEIDDAYQPCNGSAPVSMCCHLGVANNNGDVCGSGNTYGLCGITGSQLWRESCTDQTWQSPACLQLCTSGAGATGDSMITACPDGSYCCGENNATCCDANEGMFIINNRVSLTNISLSSTSSLTTSSSTTVGSSATTESSSTRQSSTPTPPSSTSDRPSSTSSNDTPTNDTQDLPQRIAPSNNGIGTGGVVGIAVGSAVVALAIGASLALLWRRRRRTRVEIKNVHADQKSEIHAGYYAVQEMDARDRPQELPEKRASMLVAEMSS